MTREFLESTRFCNHQDASVRNAARSIVGDANDPVEKAVRLFYWVRDSILYRVGEWDQTAAETLAERNGTCTNSANLLVALLRAQDIPAGYGVMRVIGNRYFGPVCPPEFNHFISESSNHIYATVMLNGVWLKVDPSDDYGLSVNNAHLSHTCEVVNWDGTTDAKLHLRDEHITEDKWPLSDIDVLIAKRPRTITGYKSEIANLYIDFLRSDQYTVDTTAELMKEFTRYLVNHRPALLPSYTLARLQFGFYSFANQLSSLSVTRL